MKNGLCFILAFGALILSSCGFKNVRGEKKSVFVERGSVAVLPFDNISNDLTAQTMMRKLVEDAFNKKGFNVINEEEVDEKLKGIGITDGGQLNSVLPQELSSLFSVRYLCYGTVNDFKFQNLGFIITRKVELNIKIYDAQKNEFIFEDTSQSSDTQLYLNKDEAKKAFIKYNAMKLVENMMKRPLYEQAVDAVNKIFAKF